MIDKLPLDVLKHIIFEDLDLLSQLRFRIICKYMYNNLHITDLYNIKYKYKIRLTDKILDRYPKIERLDIDSNPFVTKISHFINLKVLNVGNTIKSNQCKIGDDQLQYLDLIELYAWNNPRICDIGHMKNLTILDASADSGINSNSIKDLPKLKTLKLINRSSKKEICDLNHLINLRELNIANGSKINDDGIKNLINLKKLDSYNNSGIRNISSLINLLELDAGGENCSIDDDGISKLFKLQVLFCANNSKISKKMRQQLKNKGVRIID